MNLKDAFLSLDNYFSPSIIGEVNDQNYTLNDINLTQNQPDLTHYSDGIKVVAWKRQNVSR